MRTNEETGELRTKFIYESNLIENIDISFDEVWREWIKTVPKGHVAALISAGLDANTKNLLTEQMICEWQKLIIQEQNSRTTDTSKLIPESEIGQYRGEGMMLIGKKRCIPSGAVQVCMNSLIEETNFVQKNSWDSSREIIERIADLHFDFLFIHPFTDGNGRTARIMTWYLFKFFELKPFIFTSSDKHETYYKAFEGMREYFMQKSAL